MKTIITTFISFAIFASFGQDFLKHIPILQIEASGQFASIDAIASDNQYVYALSGSIGEMARSTDGIVWEEFVPSSGGAEYRALESNGTELYAYDQGFGGSPIPRILKSSDNGNNFSVDTVGYSANPLSPFFRSSLYFVNNNWWVTNGNGSPYRLNSNTNVWEQNDSINGCKDICAVGNDLFSTLDFFGLKKSTDNGVTWTDVNLSIGNSYTFNLKSFNDTLFLLAQVALTGEPYLCISGDGGNTWEDKSLSSYITTGNLGDNQFRKFDVDANQIVISATDNDNQDTNMRLIQSIDRGTNFTEHIYATHENYDVVREIYLRNDDIYVLYDGRVYSTIGGVDGGQGGGGTSSLNEKTLEKANVFPNPVESTLTLENFDLNKKVQVLNLLGQEMPVELIGNQVNVEHLPAGTYILQQDSIRLKFQKR